MSGWCVAQMMLKYWKLRSNGRTTVWLAILKIMQTGGFFSMAQILEIRMEKYIFLWFYNPVLFHLYWFPWLTKACMQDVVAAIVHITYIQGYAAILKLILYF